jgi:hypothetical protein
VEAISHMLFSNIDQKTQQVFIQLKTLVETVSQTTSKPFFIIPGYRYAFKFVIILKQVLNQCHKNLVCMQMLPVLLWQIHLAITTICKIVILHMFRYNVLS